MAEDGVGTMESTKLDVLAKAMEGGHPEDTVRVEDKVIHGKMTPSEATHTHEDHSKKEKKDPESPVSWENCDFEKAISATGWYI